MAWDTFRSFCGFVLIDTKPFGWLYNKIQFPSSRLSSECTACNEAEYPAFRVLRGLRLFPARFADYEEHLQFSKSLASTLDKERDNGIYGWIWKSFHNQDNSVINLLSFRDL